MRERVVSVDLVDDNNRLQFVFQRLAQDKTGKSSLKISVKPVGLGAEFQRLIPTGERSSLLTHTAMMENGSLCERMKS